MFRYFYDEVNSSRHTYVSLHFEFSWKICFSFHYEKPSLLSPKLKIMFNVIKRNIPWGWICPDKPWISLWDKKDGMAVGGAFESSLQRRSAELLVELMPFSVVWRSNYVSAYGCVSYNNFFSSGVSNQRYRHGEAFISYRINNCISKSGTRVGDRGLS